ncbi:major facilitator superfamily domain-containing protein [Aspergillus undulatus]|uniref:major facilitator superfamily domain-containing protein n=1 Tax=Aspergillus undulatus TaxID=1810928 RepID=UPI003CCD3FCB
MQSAGPPWLLRSRSSTVFIVATVWISSFTDYFLYAMVVPILPTALVERANVPYEDREYWVSILLMSEALTAFICCPIFGYMVDAAPNRRLPYLLGLIFLGASMGLLAFARSTTVFVIARLLQGSATAMVAVAGLALLTDSVPLDNLGQTIGYQGSAIALGFLLGPLLGGIIYDRAGYGVVMGMAFALVGVDLIMRVLVVEQSVAARWLDCSREGSDPGQPILDSQRESGYSTFVDSRSPGVSSEMGLPTAGDQRQSCYGGDEHEQDHKSPTLFQIAKQPRVAISSFGLLVQGLLFSAFDAVRSFPFPSLQSPNSNLIQIMASRLTDQPNTQTIPIFVEKTFNWSALGAGLAFLPSALTALLEPFFGYISDIYGPRLPTFISFILLPLPLCSMSFISHNNQAQMAALLSLLTLTGLLMNLATPALFVETQSVLVRLQSESQPQQRPQLDSSHEHNEQHHQPNPTPTPKTKNQNSEIKGIAQSFGLQTMAQFLGMFLGSLWGGFVEWRFGWVVMVFSLAALCFVTAWGMCGLGEGNTMNGGHGEDGWIGRLRGLFKRKEKWAAVAGEGERLLS